MRAVELSEANRRALEHVRGLSRPGVAPAADITMHFSPDRVLADGRSVAEALLAEGVYRNQFETGISNGALGGPRDGWERALFGGAYHAPGVDPSERPRYGGLNVLERLGGTCPAFGSCHLRLGPAVVERATFTFPDSVFDPTAVGVVGAFGLVESALRERIAATAGDLALHEYVEVQVHGPVRLAEDVDALVADPAYAGTPVGELLQAAADRHGFALEWHPGWVLALDEVPRDVPAGEPMRWREFCRDGAAARFAVQVIEVAAAPPRLDAAVIGRARTTGWGAQPELRNSFKDLWSIVVAFGRTRT